MPLLTLRWTLLALVGLVAACATSNVPTNASTTSAVEIDLQMHLSDVGPAWAAEGNKTMRELAGQALVGYDKPIRFISGPIPPRPPVGATVTVRFAVDNQGHVLRPQLLRVTSVPSASTASAFLGNSTIRALSQWRFTPPQRGGQSAELCCIKLTID
jgi:outer membrane biosynthesis protein TonB